MRPRRPGMRPAFTVIELLMVVSVFGIVSAIAMPRFAALREQSELTTAMTRLTRGVMAARQAAIQRGKQSYFRHSGNKIWVLVDTTGTLSDSVMITNVLDLNELYNVEVTSPAGITSIEYDPRGVSAQTSKKVFIFRHRSLRQDSLCVSKLGNTIREKCP